MAKCTIKKAHCENCGSTDVDPFDPELEGYTACCNELIAYDDDCRNHHGEA